MLATCRDDGVFPHWPKAFLDQQANQKQSLENVHETSQHPLNQTTRKQAPKAQRKSVLNLWVSTPAQKVA